MTAAAILAQTAMQFAQLTALNTSAATIATGTTAIATAETAREARELARDTDIFIETLAQSGFLAAELVAYYAAADDAIDERDDQIDKQLAFMQQLQDLKDTQDLPMVVCKKDILANLNLPLIDMSYSAMQHVNLDLPDGHAIELKSEQLLDECCGSIPDGWSMHDGSLMAHRSAGYASGLMANSEKRRVEDFRDTKTKLVRTAQIGIKSVYSAGETLQQYAQASAIHGGIADMYIQGFNSAGAALGVSLNRLTGG